MAGVIGAIAYKGWTKVDYNYLKSGIQFASGGSTNGPTSSDYMVLTMGDNDRVQLAISVSTTIYAYVRSCVNSVWYRWYTIVLE